MSKERLRLKVFCCVFRNLLYDAESEYTFALVVGPKGLTERTQDKYFLSPGFLSYPFRLTLIVYR